MGMDLPGAEFVTGLCRSILNTAGASQLPHIMQNSVFRIFHVCFMYLLLYFYQFHKIFLKNTPKHHRENDNILPKHIQHHQMFVSDVFQPHQPLDHIACLEQKAVEQEHRHKNDNARDDTRVIKRRAGFKDAFRRQFLRSLWIRNLR